MSDLGEQALGKLAEVGLASQLHDVDKLDVAVHTNPLQLLGGGVETVDIRGAGLVMQKDLRVTEMTIHTDSIHINPLKAAMGKIELTHPTDATAHVVLTEDDITRAFNSEFIRGKLQGLALEVQGQPMTVDTQQVVFQLPGADRMGLIATIYLRETQETKQVAFTARLETTAYQIRLTDLAYTQGQDLSPELTQALLTKANELGDLRNFELEGMALRLQDLDVIKGQLTLTTQIHAEQFPT
ncbi:DUF2993 domain-containing protein [Candidatus Cyanaurora vandensis]|uniref:LmeA family phospholipid-binding protein n=1 Tax=Candidatus Cyanaurora vandensis TaxID=2714958 RepID=UPI00257B599B|nr:DUF2993 domain-containing protein [Candidatus Cyanaurora vandensis]